MTQLKFHLIIGLCFLYAFGAAAQPCADLGTEYYLETSAVKDQCATGSCWAHPVTSTLEQHLRRDRNVEISLSEEFLYLRHMIENAKSVADAFWHRGKISEADHKTEALLPEGAHPDGAFAFGAVPDSVMSSRVITSSRNMFWNHRASLYRKLGNALKNLARYIRSNPHYKTNEAKLKEFERLVDGIEVSFQKRVSGKWRKDPDGQSRFEFEGQWYTPTEYYRDFVFRGKPPQVTSLLRRTATWKDIESAFLAGLEKGETSIVTLSWTADREFEWFHNVFHHKVAAHAVEIVGVKFVAGTKNIESVRIKNSWGEQFGENGFIDIPYTDFKLALNKLIYLAGGVVVWYTVV